jgi:Flp pilus assembly pilin Flp
VSVEYVLLALFIAVAVVASMMAFGGAVLGLFDAGVAAPWNGNQ